MCPNLVRKGVKMKTSNKLYAAIILAVLLLVLFTLGYQRYNEPITLSVPACDIEVECEEVFTPRSARLQAVIDKPGIAAWYGKYIMDQVIFVTACYRCIAVTTGYSDSGHPGQGRRTPGRRPVPLHLRPWRGRI